MTEDEADHTSHSGKTMADRYHTRHPEKAMDDRDEKLACRSGIIALQMHPGPPMEVQFRDLRIKIL